MGAFVKEQRTHPRTRVNWRVEYIGPSGADEIIHESSRLEDYSPSGACFLTMSELNVGMQLTLHISLPVRMARPLALRGEVVRVDDKADIGGMFKAAAVRWLPSPRRSRSPERHSGQTLAQSSSH